MLDNDRHVNVFERLPVDLRLGIIDALLERSQRRSIRETVLSYTDPHSRQYAEYLESLLYIEIGVVRLIYRFAFDQTEPGEAHIRTVHDMVEYLHKQFKQEYGYSLGHVTADVVSDLYNALIPGPGEKWVTRSNHPNSIYSRFYASTRSDPVLDDTTIVQMDMMAWHSNILSKHWERLETTGYEFIW